MSHPELDDAISEYIEARKQAETAYEGLRSEDSNKAGLAYEAIEQPAWEKFFPIKQKFWNLDNPNV